jgi:DNA-binding transcriptional MerR regulator
MSEKRRLTISEAAEITGYKPHVIRYYEREFDIEIPRNKSGHRFFTYKEIEILKYIKQLQEKGLTNTQIKLILKSPEVVINDQEPGHEVAVSHTAFVPSDGALLKLQESIIDLRNDLKESMNGLSSNLRELTDEVCAKGRDVLITENAKLKMDLKKKAYEVAELREQLKKEKNKNRTFLSRLFGK